MSKPFIKKPAFTDKGIYNSISIPDNLNDSINAYASAGEYGKLEQELANYSTELSKNNNLLHSIIQSTSLTNIQKIEVIKLLLKRGVAINTLDASNLPPIYYAIKLQLFDITKLLIERKANLNIKLPKGYDLFRTALIPSTIECPVELRDVHGDVNPSKYYSQISELERNLRQEIVKLPNINTTFITRIMEYIKIYPTMGLQYLNPNTRVLSTSYNTNILGDDEKEFLPTYTNDIYDEIKKLPSKLTNNTQLLADIPSIKIDFIKKFKDSLKVKQLNDFVKINDNYAILPADNYANIYNNIFNINNTPINVQFTNLITTYWDKISNKYIEFRDNLQNAMRRERPPIVNPNINANIANIDALIPQFLLPVPRLQTQLQIIDQFNSQFIVLIDYLIANNLEYLMNNMISKTKEYWIKIFNLFLHDINSLSSIALLKSNDYISNQKLLYSTNINPAGSYYSINNTFKLRDNNVVVGVQNPIFPAANAQNYNVYRYTLFTTSNNNNDFIANNDNKYNLNINNYNQLQVFLEWYHREIYNRITAAGSFNVLLNKFQTNNPTIKPEIIKFKMITFLNNAIKNSFIDMTNLIIDSVSNDIIKTNIINAPGFFARLLANANPTEESNIINKLVKKLQIGKFEKRLQNNYYYLDENYSNGQKIDKLLCLNNNVDLIKYLRNTIHVDVKEYSNLIFKLGMPTVLQAINNKNKITLNILESYISDHEKKYIYDINILNTQVKEELNKNRLDFFENFNLIPKEELLDINETYYKNADVYDDLIYNQDKTNKYLVSKVKTQLNNLFKNNIIPVTKKFLDFYINGVLNDSLVYDKLKDNLQQIIDDIIYYYLQIDPNDPNKPKDSKTLDNIIQNYSNLFLNSFDDQNKVSIITNYNDSFKPNLNTYIIITSEYYLNIYRNQIRYIFNKERYSKFLTNFT